MPTSASHDGTLSFLAPSVPGQYAVKLFSGATHTMVSLCSITIVGTSGSTEINDDDSRISYNGASWQHDMHRGFGDYDDDVHACTANGDATTLTFRGTGVTCVMEIYKDEGTFSVSIDGNSNYLVNAYNEARKAQVQVYTVSGLSRGTHVINITKISGQYMVVDAFIIQG
jgi:hypothetical protein